MKVRKMANRGSDKKIDILTKLQKCWSDFSECLEDMITTITFFFLFLTNDTVSD